MAIQESATRFEQVARPHPDRQATEQPAQKQQSGRQTAWHPKPGPRPQFKRLASGLGWFSIGLGLAELLFPRRLARLIGAPQRTGIIRATGARELVCGAGILSSRIPAGWLWARVAGDTVDLGLLGASFSSRRSQHDRLMTASAAVMGVAALDIYCAQQLSRAKGLSLRSVQVERSIAINRSPQECYDFWHDLENLPRFMKHLESVTSLGNRRTHWIAKGPGRMQVKWIAETTEDRPGELIAWRSVGGDVQHSGAVRFESAPGDRGTIVRVSMSYSPPGGLLGSVVARLFREEPNVQVTGDLRRFKQILETGEICTTRGQPAGAGRAKRDGLGKFDLLARD